MSSLKISPHRVYRNRQGDCVTLQGSTLSLSEGVYFDKRGYVYSETGVCLNAWSEGCRPASEIGTNGYDLVEDVTREGQILLPITRGQRITYIVLACLRFLKAKTSG